MADSNPLAPLQPPSGPLAGIGVIVTRPQRQAAAFATRIAALGAAPLIWPAIVIVPPPDTAPLERAHAALASYDIAVFVSANAVEYGAPPPRAWPARLIAFAPGPATAEALAGVGIFGARVPTTTHDSEGLLQLPELAELAGKRVVVFRGEGGREFLGNALRARGAVVDHVACYRRVAPTAGTEGLVEALRSGAANALTLTSAEGLDNLVAALPAEGRAMLARIPVFAGHPRIAERARECGLRAVEATGGDAGLLAGLLEWFRTHPGAGAGAASAA
ncbi:MAG: uroporphyrinogen-III synthase [Proteobacteria bacterium]|jgi:uroporphyrinogen-III synthase|nr:uroporphyrinogen-III synthase [Pseudomonadota bacterium]